MSAIKITSEEVLCHEQYTDENGVIELRVIVSGVDKNGSGWSQSRVMKMRLVRDDDPRNQTKA